MPLSTIDTSSISGLGYGFKNRIINGGMVIDQRNAGASQTITAGATPYTVDRWLAYCTGANITTQRVAGTSPYQYALRITGAASNTLIQFLQRIESYNCYDLAGQSFTFSCTLKASTATTVNVYFANANATDNYSGATTFASTSFNVTTTAQTFTFTTTAAANVTNGMYAMFAFNSGLGSGVTFDITGVQLEAGTVATSFDWRSYGTELALCQRYYAKSFLQGTAPASNVGTTSGSLVYTTQTTNTQYITGQCNLPVTMRTAPTITTYNPYAAGSGWSASGAGSYTATSYSIGDSSIVMRNDTVVGSAGSNLSLHWTASAEL